MTLTSLIVPAYSQMLGTLSGWLDKAQAQLPAGQAEALLSARLAPDMYPLATQIRFACVQAHEAVYRLQGEAFPASLDVLLNEGREAGERPGSIADAKARIGEAIALLESLSADALDMVEGAPVEHALPNGIILDLTAEQYARDWTLSQFYFHLMIAYAILRAQGVALGKADYVAHMFGHIRPGTMPG
ncbi:DUF1993 domain-containing protein [Sphingobium sp. Z007]|uniref:DUF1993 domain-containing protein n=1 Tax=Sphingobium sp. Z007 TaxID=627495 RepID=UPI000B4A3618|nr:DUF1993 domain-containing protein [Sphingobium sp. Z007]